MDALPQPSDILRRLARGISSSGKPCALQCHPKAGCLLDRRVGKPERVSVTPTDMAKTPNQAVSPISIRTIFCKTGRTIAHRTRRQECLGYFFTAKRRASLEDPDGNILERLEGMPSSFRQATDGLGAARDKVFPMDAKIDEQALHAAAGMQQPKPFGVGEMRFFGVNGKAGPKGHCVAHPVASSSCFTSGHGA